MLSLSFILLGAAPYALATSAGSYAPTFVQCPSNLTVRPASMGLGPDEIAWRNRRFPQVLNSLGPYLQIANISGFNVSAYLDKINQWNLPIAGLAISGGGAQSGVNGLGVYQALDARHEPSVKAGTGGLLQTLSYLTGLSGGGIWAVLPLATNNMSTVKDLIGDADYHTNYNTGPTGNSSQYYSEIFYAVAAKADAGFFISASDILGQTFRQFLVSPFYRFSDVAEPNTAFSRGLAPMPITLYSEVVPGQSPEIHDIMYPEPNISTVYEANPYEFGSWIGGRVQAFFPTKYLGTQMMNGKVAGNRSDSCVNGFDKVTFMQGGTGNAFNLWLTSAWYGFNGFFKRSIPIPPGGKTDNIFYPLVHEVAQVFNNTFNQTLWSTWPNPFKDINAPMKNVDDLLLVDGSEAGETIPLRPLVVTERKVDFIIAYDSSGDYLLDHYPNGTTFRQSSIVAHNLGLPFPEVPDSSTFMNLGLNRYPTFFGCNDSLETPLVLYLPNAPWTAYSNYSFTKPSWTQNQLDVIFENSFNLVTYGNGSLPSSQAGSVPFAQCIACGLIAKSLQRTGQSVPATCQTCFAEHCYNGTVQNSPSYPLYDPGLLLSPNLTYQEWEKSVWNRHH